MAQRSALSSLGEVDSREYPLRMQVWYCIDRDSQPRRFCIAVNNDARFHTLVMIFIIISSLYMVVSIRARELGMLTGLFTRSTSELRQPCSTNIHRQRNILEDVFTSSHLPALTDGQPCEKKSSSGARSHPCRRRTEYPHLWTPRSQWKPSELEDAK